MHARRVFEVTADPGKMIRGGLYFLLIILLCGDVYAQTLQRLLEDGKGSPSGEKPHPSAAEQKNWASEKLAEYQAKEKSLNVEELREEFRAARLPETRLDEFLSASKEITAIMKWRSRPWQR